ncbi:MAG: TetR family transcriptional regulator [Alphaproteobacteria bacterium]|nr:MAG: TetR family transcriptional regulator [Alphaproteobacteria bacterium]
MMSKEQFASAGDAAPARERRNAILDAGLAMFMRYGFNRVTMDDIAQAAGISRPALYRDFRNKADIYAALAERMLDRAAAAAEVVLTGPAPLGERLVRAIEVGILDHLAEISASPHGAEILERKEELTGDIVAGWRERMTTALARAIGVEARARRLDLARRGFSERALAESILDSLEGAKHRSSDPAEWRAATARLVTLALLALD